MNPTNLSITHLYENRKSICLSINLPHGFILKAPHKTPINYINQFILSKKTWLTKIETSLKNSFYLLLPENFTTGNKISYLGTQYTIKQIDSKKIKIYFNETNLIIESPDNKDNIKLKKHVISWYKNISKDIFLDRIQFYCQKLNISVPTLRLKSQKTRWGSCSNKQNINLNWLLIKTPLEIIDYVILHECCHLIHMNHSKDFWNLVQKFMPDYKLKMKWLKEKGPVLMANLNLLKV